MPNMHRLCDGDCNHCPLILHPNARQLQSALNEAYRRFGEPFYIVMEAHCPNLTCCSDCGADDFTHLRGCSVQESGRHQVDAWMERKL